MEKISLGIQLDTTLCLYGSLLELGSSTQPEGRTDLAPGSDRRLEEAFREAPLLPELSKSCSLLTGCQGQERKSQLPRLSTYEAEELLENGSICRSHGPLDERPTGCRDKQVFVERGGLRGYQAIPL